MGRVGFDARDGLVNKRLKEQEKTLLELKLFPD